MQKRAALVRRPKSREETPKEGSDKASPIALSRCKNIRCVAQWQVNSAGSPMRPANAGFIAHKGDFLTRTLGRWSTPLRRAEWTWLSRWRFLGAAHGPDRLFALRPRACDAFGSSHPSVLPIGARGSGQIARRRF